MAGAVAAACAATAGIAPTITNEKATVATVAFATRVRGADLRQRLTKLDRFNMLLSELPAGWPDCGGAPELKKGSAAHAGRAED